MAGPNGIHAQKGEAERDAERNAQIFRLRTEEWTQGRIAEKFGISQQRVSQICDEEMKNLTVPAADEMRKAAAAKFALAEQAVWEVLRREHVVIQGGKPVRHSHVDEEGVEHLGDIITDDKPILDAVDRLLRIEARRAATFGYEAPQKVEMSAGVKYEIVGISNEDMR
jgi:predicted XRE-type DNA-binding protein